MSDFLTAVQVTLKHEGGYVDNSADKGGPTNMGVTQKDMPSVDLRTLTSEQAEVFYQKKFWNPLFGSIRCQDVCTKIFDMGVLFGVGTAARLAQAVLGIRQSEVFDAATLSAVNVRGEAFLVAYKGRLVAHARWIPTQDPSQEVFLAGWESRINS